MDIKDDLKNIKIELQEEPSEEEQLKKLKRKKIAIAAVGLFLAALLIIYLIPGNYILFIIEGQFASSKLEGSTVELETGGKVIFDRAVYEELKQLYLEEQETEFKVCLIGEKKGEDYYISGLSIPETESKSFAHVSAELCPKEAIIPLHTHPYKHCIFSEQDIQNFEAVKAVNPDAIIGLMCETDRFNFYGY
jgi:proteasome lid subunit RPN8/RPN11